MQPGTAWGGLPKSLSAFPVPATNYKRALKLSLAAAVFSAFLCLPLAAGWVNCSDSGTIVPCERAMGTPVCGGSLARPCRLPREQRGGPGTGSTAAPWWPGDGPCMSHIVPGSVSAHPLCPAGNCLEVSHFWESSGLPSHSCAEGADVGDVSCSGCPLAQTPPLLVPVPLQSCVSPAMASNLLVPGALQGALQPPSRAGGGLYAPGCHSS